MKAKTMLAGSVYLYDTSVENIFISEYMPIAPGEYVKIFLMLKMYAETGLDFELEDIAKNLKVEVDEIEKALLYWVKAGLLVRSTEELEFVSLKEQLYGKKGRKSNASSKGKELLQNARLKKLLESLQAIVGKEFSGSDLQEISNWVDTFKATDEVILGAAKHCVNRGKKSIKYIGKVVVDWAGRGLATAEDVENYLAQIDEQHYTYKRVMEALGFRRNPTENERRLIDKWVLTGRTMEEILAACDKTSGISNPNLNYVDAVLMETGSHKSGEDKKPDQASRAAKVQERYAIMRERAASLANARLKEICTRIPRLGELHDAIMLQNQKLAKVLVSGGTDKLRKMAELQDGLKKLERERDRIMTENNIPIDYTNIKYTCRICCDTGVMNDGRRCSCWLEREKEI